MIACDIHFAVFHQLAKWHQPSYLLNGRDEASDARSLGALGEKIAASLGLPLAEACRLAVDEPGALITRSREAQRYLRGDAP
jgi:hypothetical protein